MDHQTLYSTCQSSFLYSHLHRLDQVHTASLSNTDTTFFPAPSAGSGIHKTSLLITDKRKTITGTLGWIRYIRPHYKIHVQIHRGDRKDDKLCEKLTGPITIAPDEAPPWWPPSWQQFAFVFASVELKVATESQLEQKNQSELGGQRLSRAAA